MFRHDIIIDTLLLFVNSRLTLEDELAIFIIMKKLFRIILLVPVIVVFVIVGSFSILMDWAFSD